MQNKTQGRGYTLLEILIVLAVLAGAVVGVLRLFALGSVKAATQREQTSISALVDAVRGVYASSPSYAGITMSTVEQQARLDQVLRANGTPVSAFGGTLTLAAATVSAPDDAFSIRINPLDTKACAALVPALAGQTARVSTTSGGNIQAKPGVVPNGSDIAKACAGAFFQKNQGALTLVYYSPRATGAAARPGPSCAQSCAPQTQTQTLTCPTGQVGQVNQTRSGTCSTAACPVQVWSPWTTVSSSCAVAPAPPLPIVPTPPTDPAQSCVPRTETRSLGCPAPQVGKIDQTQTVTCDAGGGEHLGAWKTVGNTCLAPPPACTDGVLTGVDACAAGEYGQVSWIKEMTCASGGLAIGPKKITGSSCSPIGTCRPSRAPDGQKNMACAAGEFGQVIQTLEKTSTCSSATATPIWGPDTVISSTGACAACPVPKTETQSVPCPAGQVGLITQSRSVSYACASAPTSLPGPTYGAWTTTSNTCVIATCTPSGGGVWSVNVISMQVGPFSGTPTATPYDTVTFNPATGIAYMQTGPTTSRFVATGNIVFDLTVGAQTQQYTVACTQANSTLNSAGSHITDECLYTGSVTLNGATLNVTVDAGGIVATDHVNGTQATTSIRASFEQGGGCTNPAAQACVPYGNGVANGITVTPIDLNLTGLGDKGAVLGAYGSTAVSAAPTGTASFQISYKGDTQTVNVACDATNNTSGGTVACQGAPVPITVGGSAFLASLNTNGPFLDQGKYWDATVSVSQNCLHWILAGTDIVQTNVMNQTTTVSGQGTEIPNQDVVPTNGPVTWVIPVNDRIGSGDGPGPNVDPNNSWNGFLNMTGLIQSVPWNTQNNPGYGNPTNPWAGMYASGNYKVYAGPTASQYGTNVVTASPACTQGANTMFATQWNTTYPMQLLYDGFTCGIGQVTTFAGSSGSPQPPPTGCVKSAASRKVLPDGSVSSTPMMLPPPGC
ncbi:MAG: type II secretion system protein [Xanthomonadaceae bacterium]|nr:type II secretion system protein [Xanthomonadaceae bacterium]